MLAPAVHAFTLVFEFRCDNACSGALATVVAAEVGGRESARRQVVVDPTTGHVHYGQEEGWTGGSGSSATTLGLGPAVNDGKWHQVAISHFHARGATSVYVDGKLVRGRAAAGTGGAFHEHLIATKFTIGVSSTQKAVRYRDLLIYRCGLNADEVAFLWINSAVLGGSLEVFAPLDDTSGEPAENLAQSLSQVSMVCPGGVTGGTIGTGIVVDKEGGGAIVVLGSSVAAGHGCSVRLSTRGGILALACSPPHFFFCCRSCAFSRTPSTVLTYVLVITGRSLSSLLPLLAHNS